MTQFHMLHKSESFIDHGKVLHLTSKAYYGKLMVIHTIYMLVMGLVGLQQAVPNARPDRFNRAG